MALTAPQRLAGRRWLVDRFIDSGPVNYSKVDVDAALDAATTWVEANAASFVTAISTTALAGATVDQKVILLVAAAINRYGVRL